MTRVRRHKSPPVVDAWEAARAHCVQGRYVPAVRELLANDRSGEDVRQPARNLLNLLCDAVNAPNTTSSSGGQFHRRVGNSAGARTAIRLASASSWRSPDVADDIHRTVRARAPRVIEDLEPHLRTIQRAAELNGLAARLHAACLGPHKRRVRRCRSRMQVAWDARRRFVDRLSERQAEAMRSLLDRLRTRARDTDCTLRDQWRQWYGSLRPNLIRSLAHPLDRQVATAKPQWPRLPGVDFHPTLNDGDHDLIRIWNPRHGDDRNRLESARRAERAAVEYYRRLGSAVADVSIQQVSRPDGGDWRTHDLTVDDRPLDVKNMRRSTVRERLGELLWRQKCRHVGRSVEDVGIVGVVSDRDAPHRSTVLGEARRASFDDVRTLAEDMHRLFGIEIKGTRHLSNKRHFGDEKVPGWFFQYPPSHYGAAPWAWLPQCIALARKYDEPVHDWLVPLAASWQGRAVSEADSGDREFLQALCCLRGQDGLVSLRKVFLFAILYLLSSRRSGARARSAFVRLLFPFVDTTARGLRDRTGDADHVGWSFPLGLHDPARYVRHVVNALGTVLESRPDELDGVEFFRLQGPWILKAEVEGKWLTVLAYCGGCGEAPLVIGRSRTCPCGKGRLVCPMCGHCHEKCAGHFCGQEEARRIVIDLNDSMATSDAKWFWSRADGVCRVQPPRNRRS